MIPSKKVVIYTALFLITLITLTYKLGGEYFLMTGALSDGHEILSNDCKHCHTPFKNDFKNCSTCHQEVKKVSLHLKSAIDCIFCHKGHNERFKQVDAMTCLTAGCHIKMMKESDHSGNPQMCFNCHPEHHFDKERIDFNFSDLIFSHRIHTDNSNPKAYYPCGSCHQVSSNEFRMGIPEALVQCKNCHSKWVGKHDVKKSLEDKDCSRCHYIEKKELKGLGEKHRLKYARFNHKKHLNMECTTCHFNIKTYNELEDIFIFLQEPYSSLCTQCHLNPFI